MKVGEAWVELTEWLKSKEDRYIFASIVLDKIEELEREYE